MRICTGDVCVRSSVGAGLAVRRDVVDEQRVELATCRMALAHVQRLEVVPVGLDLGALGDLESEPDEHVLEALPGLRDEVRVPARRPADELGQVESFGRDPLVERDRAERRAAILERRGDRGHRLVDGLAGRLLLVDRIERAEACLELGELALLAGEPGGEFADRVEARSRVDRGESGVAGGGDVGDHVVAFRNMEWRTGTDGPDELRTWRRSE